MKGVRCTKCVVLTSTRFVSQMFVHWLAKTICGTWASSENLLETQVTNGWRNWQSCLLQLCINYPSNEVGADKSDCNALDENKQGGSKWCEIVRPRRLQLQFFEERDVQTQVDAHGQGEQCNRYDGRIQSKADPRHIIAHRLWVLPTVLPYGYVEDTKMDESVQYTEVGLLCQPKQVHEDEQASKACKHH